MLPHELLYLIAFILWGSMVCCRLLAIKFDAYVLLWRGTGWLLAGGAITCLSLAYYLGN